MFGETFKNFSVNFFSSNQRLDFSSGEVISGEIKFELSKDARIQHLSMTLKGKAKVHWTTRHGSGKRRRTRHHSAKIVYFKLENKFLQGPTDEMTLRQGIHVYPFSCQIPRGNFPPSFIGVHGRIAYTVKFGIHRSWHMAKEFESEFKFVNHDNDTDPVLLMPLSASSSKTVCCLWCASGPITLDARLEKKGYVPGEHLKVLGQIGNASSRRVVPKAVLVQKQTFYTQNKISTRVVPRFLVSSVGHTVEPNTSDVYLELTLAIPDDAPVSISNCDILVVEYYVMVSLQISGSTNLETLFPIQLHQEECRPPPYSSLCNTNVF